MTRIIYSQPIASVAPLRFSLPQANKWSPSLPRTYSTSTRTRVYIRRSLNRHVRPKIDLPVCRHVPTNSAISVPRGYRMYTHLYIYIQTQKHRQRRARRNITRQYVGNNIPNPKIGWLLHAAPVKFVALALRRRATMARTICARELLFVLNARDIYTWAV